MTTVCVVVSDRPKNLYLNGCLDNLDIHLPPHTRLRVVDDTAHELGMAGAVQEGFRWALEQGADHVLWIEEDFRLHNLPLEEMTWVLHRCPHLAQVVLKRQPWSQEEIAAGGQIELGEQRGDTFTECWGLNTSIRWVEHTSLFSLNPCLIPKRTLQLGWPSGGLGVGNEAGFTQRCADAGMRFAYYGKKDDPPRCEHVGQIRGTGWKL